MLPEAMVAYLENHGPEKFAQIFLGEYDTPEAIWNHEMRTFMMPCISHLNMCFRMIHMNVGWHGITRS